MKISNLFFIIVLFSFNSCTNKTTIEYIKSGNELVLSNGTLVHILKASSSSNNKQYLSINFLFKEIILTDKNYNLISNGDNQKLSAFIFLYDGTCLNDLLEKERFAGSLNEGDSINFPVDNSIIDVIPIQKINDTIGSKITPVFGCDRWQNIDVKGSKDISDCYDYVQDVFKKNKIKNLPHLPVRIINKIEMCKMAGSLSVIGLAHTKSWDDGTLIHEIYIVENLPRLDFTQVLAHEILHTWVKQNHITLSTTTEEGLCNYASYLILIEVQNDYSQRLITDMLSNPDPVYGGGFRKVKNEIDKEGLDIYMLNLKKNNN